MDSQLSITLRPKLFTDVIGHDSAVAVLKKQIDEGSVPRAMMFVGSAGTGKTTLARIVARAVQGWDFDPDTEPDIMELNAAAVRGIDAIKELVEDCATYPMVGKFRVVILDEAHQLTKDAQNVLLKPMEEKDSATVWIICTTETNKILPAIKTRCQVFELTGMSKKNIHDLIVRAAEFVGISDNPELPAFEAEAILRKLTSPRPLLNAFENFYKGMPVQQAVNGQTQTYAPQHFEIAKAVVYGDWFKDGVVWQQPSKAVKTQLAMLEEAFKAKKASADDVETEADQSDDETAIAGRPEVANGLRAMVASLLKNELIKYGNPKAADALYILSHCASYNPGDNGMLYPAVLGGLFRVNAKMRGTGPAPVRPS